jgi:hypothetical protein
LTDANALCRSLLERGWEKYLEIANNYSAFYRHDLDNTAVFVKSDGSVEIVRPMNHPDREVAITVKDGKVEKVVRRVVVERKRLDIDAGQLSAALVEKLAKML